MKSRDLKSRLTKAAGAEPAGQMRDEKLHAVVARSTLPSQNVQSIPGPDHFWKLRCRKSARRCGAKRVSKSTCTKHTRFGPLLEVAMSKKCMPLWCEADFGANTYKTHQLQTTFGSWDVESARLCGAKHISKSKCTKTHQVRTTLRSWDVEKVHAVVARSTFPKSKCTKHHMFAPFLEVQMCFRVAGARDCARSQKWAKREGFPAFPKTMAGVWHLKMHFPWQAQYKRHLIAVGRSGRWFLERGCILEHQIFRFAEMILRGRCSISCDLASLFHGRCIV